MIRCAVCGQSFRSISNSHLLYKHNMTPDEYAHLYGGHLTSEETRKLQRIDYGIDWDKAGLGKKPDSIIAKETNVNRRTIASIRAKRGIPAFVGLILTQESEPCRSIYEATYDAYLHWKEIEHAHEVRVGDLPYIADFKIRNTYVEIIGMALFAKYERKLANKRKAYTDAKIDVIWLTPEQVEDLFEGCPVKINFRDTRICERCGKATHDLVKNVCRKCYMYVWRRFQFDQ